MEDKLLLSQGSMSDMTDEQLRVGIEQIRAQRESLASAARATAKLTGASNAKPPRAKKQPDPDQVALLKLLKGEV